MSASNSFFSALFDLLSRLFGSRPAPTPPSSPVPPPESTTTPPLAPLHPRVLMIIYDPVVEPATSRRLVEVMGWNDPDSLARDYMADVMECSGGLINYQIAERLVADEIPVKADRFQYQVQDYVNAMNGRGRFHDPDAVDYNAILDQFNLLSRAANDEFDEVWLFGGPYFGFNEATMAGAGAFFVNGGPIPHTDACPRRFVVMGFNYERGVGEMLEDLGHRAEYTLGHLFGVRAFVDAAYGRPPRFLPSPAGPNLLERLLSFDLIAPGQSNVGTMHYAPNSVSDYDWGNSRPVPSCADDWLQFPDLPNPPNYRTVTRGDWGGGDMRAHHKWWFHRLPKSAGLTRGIANNWWSYVIDPNQVK